VPGAGGIWKELGGAVKAELRPSSFKTASSVFLLNPLANSYEDFY